MNILYTCDNNYVWLMGISVISLFENNRHIEELSVYLLGEGISKENKEHLNEIAKRYMRHISVIDIPIFDISPMILSARWPLSAYTRLFAGELLPKELDKVLYLDCDTIISGNIEALNMLEFDNKVVMGVKDCIGRFYKENIGMNGDDIYINAGVLLFNLSELRKIDITDKIEKYIKKYNKLINYADQDILNGMLKGRIGILEPKYNVMTIDVVHTYREILTLRRPTNFYSEFELQEAVRESVVIHYTTNMLIVRPWFVNADHPLTSEFRKYMEKSIWKGKELEIMSFSAKEAKIIRVIRWFPKIISYPLLGLIHAVLKPLYIYNKARGLKFNRKVKW